MSRLNLLQYVHDLYPTEELSESYFDYHDMLGAPETINQFLLVTKKGKCNHIAMYPSFESAEIGAKQLMQLHDETPVAIYDLDLGKRYGIARMRIVIDWTESL